MSNFNEKFESEIPEEKKEDITQESAVEGDGASKQEKKYISYLGVSLEKAQDRGNSPNPEKYSDYIEDEFSLELQRDIAVSFESGDPILIEGGTSIGKTTTVKKMCADLGWEVYYVNLNGATDVEDLMGRYTPNPDKKTDDDPEFIFSEGRVTSGLKQEEGKIKVILLDEFNSAAPNIIIRLHEVLDALERKGEVVLSENASMRISVDNTKTKIIALTNPPGRGYLGREPLDPAQLRRWVYKKAPTNLPDEVLSHSIKALFGTDVEIEIPSEDSYIYSRKTVLTQEQLKEIPGIEEILARYEEFHIAAKALVSQRQLAKDQPQPFTFDDRMEPRRVMNFVRLHYAGNTTETFQQALRYYYLNKLESEEDREKLEELVSFVKYTPEPGESRRLGLEDEFNEEHVHYELFEDEIIERAKEVVENTHTTGLFLFGFAGMDSSEAWELRNKEGYEDYLHYSLAGVDSEKAWGERDDPSVDLSSNKLAISLVGLDSEKAWGKRHDELEEKEAFLISIMGLSDLIAQGYRQEALEGIKKLEGENKKKLATALQQSLIGVDDDSSWQIREELLRMGVDARQSIYGLNSRRAWQVRENLLKNNDKNAKEHLAESLAGIDSERSWEIRDELSNEGGYEKQIIYGMACLNSERAKEMRENLSRSVSEEDTIRGISGDYRMVAVRKGLFIDTEFAEALEGL